MELFPFESELLVALDQLKMKLDITLKALFCTTSELQSILHSTQVAAEEVRQTNQID